MEWRAAALCIVLLSFLVLEVDGARCYPPTKPVLYSIQYLNTGTFEYRCYCSESVPPVMWTQTAAIWTRVMESMDTCLLLDSAFVGDSSRDRCTDCAYTTSRIMKSTQSFVSRNYDSITEGCGAVAEFAIGEACSFALARATLGASEALGARSRRFRQFQKAMRLAEQRFDQLDAATAGKLSVMAEDVFMSACQNNNVVQVPEMACKLFVDFCGTIAEEAAFYTCGLVISGLQTVCDAFQLSDLCGQGKQSVTTYITRTCSRQVCKFSDNTNTVSCDSEVCSVSTIASKSCRSVPLAAVSMMAPAVGALFP